MPVDTRHPQYTAMYSTWQRMRDVSAGQDAIHKAGQRYLPKLAEETPEDYHARKTRANFFNATWRTIEGFLGMLFRKAPVVEISAGVATMLEDVTKTGVSLATFAQTAAEEVLTVGRVGIMTDYPAANTDGMTVKQLEDLNLRPHLALYPTESIINWRTEWRDNRSMLVLVVLEESYEITDPNDQFSWKCEKQWRVLDLEAGGYRQRVFRKDAQRGQFVHQEFRPTLAGGRLREIPFQFAGVDDTTPTIDLPPLLDLANVNLSHYLSTADVEHGAHKTALPTPWATGVQPGMDENGRSVPVKFYLGGSSMITLPSPDSKVGMLEYGGGGLAAIETRIEKKETQMAVLGARMLEQQKRAVESAETAGLHRSGEQSSLAATGNTLGQALSNALGWFAAWAGGDRKAVCTINSDFLPVGLSAQELTALVGAWQSGAMSKEALFEKLQAGGVIADGRTFEDEETAIENSPPVLMAGAAPAPGEDNLGNAA